MPSVIKFTETALSCSRATKRERWAVSVTQVWHKSPEKWILSQAPFRGSNASGGNILLLSGAAPANQTEESEVSELPGKESGTGPGTPCCL